MLTDNIKHVRREPIYSAQTVRVRYRCNVFSPPLSIDAKPTDNIHKMVRFKVKAGVRARSRTRDVLREELGVGLGTVKEFGATVRLGKW